MSESNAARFSRLFAATPLIAILRGIKPDEAVAVGTALCDAGFTLIETPLNSLEPFESIRRLVDALGDRAMIGAGTMMTPDEVRRLDEAGGTLAVSPHCDPDVIKAAVARGLVSIPGVLSPTEAFGALRAGAHALKLFPMEIIGAKGAKAMRAVLPRETRLIAVGGVTPAEIAPLRAAGCDGFGLGGALYAPAATAAEVAEKARAFMASVA